MQLNNPSTDPSEDQTSTKTTLKSSLVSRNIIVSRRRTSVRLEPEMWEGLRELCRRERSTMHQICTTVALQKNAETSLTAAIRVYVMRYYRQAATEDGHTKAGHGYGLTLGMHTMNNAMNTTSPTPNHVARMAAFAGRMRF